MSFSYNLNDKYSDVLIFAITDFNPWPELLMGDYVLCDPEVRPSTGDLVIAEIGRSYYLGKFEHDRETEVKKLRLLHDACPTLRIDSDQSVIIIGRVVNFMKCI